MNGNCSDILIVDDVPANLRHLAEILESNGYKVKPAQNGEMALRAAQTALPDLILLDVMMPGIDGYEVCRRLKENPRLKEIPVIFISALEETSDKVKAFTVGGVDYLTKPFEPQEVLARVKTHLELRRLQVSLRQAYEKVELRVTERTAELEKATEALRKSETKYRELVENANSIILRMDRQGRITYFNEYAQKFFGFDPEELLGCSALGTIVPPTDSSGKNLMRMIEDICQHPERYESNQNENARRNGERVWVVWTNKPVHDENGVFSEILCVGNDLTEQKKIQDQLLRAQRIESVGRLANGVAHDLNNILTPILMFVELLREKLVDREDLDMLDMIKSSTHRGAQIVQQLLIFSRGTSGTRMALDLHHLVREISQIISATFPKSIVLETKQPDDIWPVQGDPTQIHQVLLNLCVNARDAMPEGGTLSIEMENVIFDEATAKAYPDAKSESYVVLGVFDTGVGMAQETIDKIFDPFFTTKPKGQGTGLGLSTVVGIVKDHGGFIQVQSQVGIGSQFRIYWPAMRLKMANLEEPACPKAISGASTLILIVDDEPAVRETTSAFLKSKGYRVLAAKDGQDALALYALAKQEIRLVLADIWMPSMDGLAVIREMHNLNPQVRIIATSGLAELESQALAASPAVKAFLHKPWQPAQLLELLNQVNSRDQG